jgi:hypothetical protein
MIADVHSPDRDTARAVSGSLAACLGRAARADVPLRLAVHARRRRRVDCQWQLQRCGWFGDHVDAHACCNSLNGGFCGGGFCQRRNADAGSNGFVWPFRRNRKRDDVDAGRRFDHRWSVRAGDRICNDINAVIACHRRNEHERRDRRGDDCNDVRRCIGDDCSFACAGDRRRRDVCASRRSHRRLELDRAGADSRNVDAADSVRWKLDAANAVGRRVDNSLRS